MIPARLIEAKRDGLALTSEEIADFFRGYLEGSVDEYQMSAFLMAVVFRGLDEDELITLLETMVGSGATLDLGFLDGPKVDKHSTGGVGDKVSVPLAPVAASMGLFVPMMSGRGLGHTGGTLDKLESIPGFRTALGLGEFKRVLSDVGCAMIGQTAEIAPLDRRLYDLRSVTGTVPAIPLIASSIMSKKIAEGLDGLVLDVKVGEGAFLPEIERGRELAQVMTALGARAGVRTVARLTAMDRPLGRAIGNALEISESIECLRGGGPSDLRAVVVELAAEMAWVGGLTSDLAEGRVRATEVIDSGQAFEVFLRLVDAQGGDTSWIESPERHRTAPFKQTVSALESGRVFGISPMVLGAGVIELGGGRTRLGQEIDPRVGFDLAVSVGDSVQAGEPLGTVHAGTPEAADVAARCLAGSIKWEGADDALDLFMDRIYPDQPGG